MDKKLNILMLEDSPWDYELVEHELRKGGLSFSLKRVETRDQFERAVDSIGPDIVLADYTLPSYDGRSALKYVRSRFPDIPFLFISGTIGEEAAIETLKTGATDYVLKTRLSRLVPAVNRALREVRERIERKRAEQALVESEQRYRTLFETSPDAIVFLDLNIDVIVANLPSLALFGYESVEEVKGRNALTFFVREEHAKARERMRQLIAYGSLTGSIEHTMLKKNGDTFPGWVKTSLVADSTGKPQGILAVIRDSTEIKQAERAARESERRYKKLVESVTDYIYTVKVENGCPVSTSHGPGCVAVTGYTPEEYAQDLHLWHRMIYETDRGIVLEQAAKVLSGEAAPPIEHRILHKNGSIRWIKNTPVLRCDEAGCLIGYDGLIADITERKKLEDQLYQAQKMEAVGQLAGGVAHDFNNILTAIIGYVYILQTKMSDDDPLRHNIEQILAASEKAANLTQRLLMFSRKKIINPKPVRLRDIIERTKNLLVRIIGEDIEFKTTFNDDGATVMADAGQIEQVLMNLATNARDALPEGGLLAIETARIELDKNFIKSHGYGEPGQYALINVSDTGIGMDAKTREKIFAPFFTTKEVGKGTGLGLSIVYGIVKQHKGYVNVYSEPNCGTTFKIYLPLTTAEIEKAETKEQSALSCGSEMILLAEDEVDVRRITKTLLEEFGYSVIEAVDGDEAIKKFNENKDSIKLLLLDLIMPKKNGKMVHDEIKKREPGIKTLFMSGYTADVIDHKGILGQDAGIVAKPILPRELLKQVQKALGH